MRENILKIKNQKHNANSNEIDEIVAVNFIRFFNDLENYADLEKKSMRIEANLNNSNHSIVCTINIWQIFCAGSVF